jgi:uncharacterized phage protein (TIGR01671 family)
MREFKFKVWDTKFKEFSNWTNRDPFFDMSKGGLFFWERQQREDGTYAGDIVLEDTGNRFVIQQFTGLKDKNDKEIYEGDIIQLEGSPISYSIEWDKYQWAINAHGALGYDPDWNIQPFNHCVYERAIVVGNIFENNDLLKQ